MCSYNENMKSSNLEQNDERQQFQKEYKIFVNGSGKYSRKYWTLLFGIMQQYYPNLWPNLTLNQNFALRANQRNMFCKMTNSKFSHKGNNENQLFEAKQGIANILHSPKNQKTRMTKCMCSYNENMESSHSKWWAAKVSERIETFKGMVVATFPESIEK